MFGKINVPDWKNSKVIQSTNQVSQSEKAKQSTFKNKIIEKEPRPNKQYNSNDYLHSKREKINMGNKQRDIKNKIKQEKELKSHLEGSKFRLLNELLYTNNSQDALQHFKQHQEDFTVYHQGFRKQTQKWEINPLNVIVTYITKKYLKDQTQNKINSKKLILDLGCGDGQLSEILQNKQIKMKKKILKIRSFDLVSSKTYIQIADIAHLPVDNDSVDSCIFCLSLMGTNYLDFILEAKRVLKKSSKQPGQLLIAEVQSRCDKWQDFVQMLQNLGFICFRNKTIGSKNEQSEQNKIPHKNEAKINSDYFRILYFRVDPTKINDQLNLPQIKEVSKQILQGCYYKRR